jgi:hypothetical protein
MTPGSPNLYGRRKWGLPWIFTSVRQSGSRQIPPSRAGVQGPDPAKLRAVGREDRMYLGRVSAGEDAPIPCIHGRRISLIEAGPDVAVAGCPDCQVEWEPAHDGLDLYADPVDSDDAVQAEKLALEWLSVFEPDRDPNLAEELAVANYEAHWAYGQLTDKAWELFRAWRYAREAG